MDNSLKNKRQREHRARNNNAHTHKYEKTINGFLMRKYRNMESRVKGIQKIKFHLYEGKELIGRESFYRWSKSSKLFLNLFREWKDSGYERRLCPSVDRIDSKLGYVLSNMEWVTHSENSRRGSLSKSRRRYSPNS